jgi:hypothetical protein
MGGGMTKCRRKGRHQGESRKMNKCEVEEGEPYGHAKRSDERKENHQGMEENSLIFFTDYLFLFTIYVQCVSRTQFLHLFLI